MGVEGCVGRLPSPFVLLLTDIPEQKVEFPMPVEQREEKEEKKERKKGRESDEMEIVKESKHLFGIRHFFSSLCYVESQAWF